VRRGGRPLFFGQRVYRAVYVTYSAPGLQVASVWAAVLLVAALVLLFAAQFTAELTEYGGLMARPADKDRAKDSFFYSFTGAVVYGHGKPRNISARFKAVVAFLTDGLFLVVSLRLLSALACDYSDVSSPRLIADQSVVCWEGGHAALATAALTAYALYVPLSIMIAPMLLEAAPAEGEEAATAGGGEAAVSYSKLYLMVVNVVKSVMLLVGALGPSTLLTAVVSSAVGTTRHMSLLSLCRFLRIVFRLSPCIPLTDY
jgi:hypothetical protein